MAHNFIERVRNCPGKFIPANGDTCFKTGDDVAEWLSGQGYIVIETAETFTEGFAITDCGICVSRNGYAYAVEWDDRKNKWNAIHVH